MSAFDPTAFLDSATTEAFEKLPPLPVGAYTAVIGSMDTKTGDKQDGSQWTQIIVPLTVQVPADVQVSHKMPDTLKMTDRIFLDLTPAGHLDTAPGRNSHLRKYRQALGMNKPGEPFAPRLMEGRVIQINIEHEIYNEEVVARIGKNYAAA
jgi:hypothetical protein